MIGRAVDPHSFLRIRIQQLFSMQILIRIQLLFKCGSEPGSSFKNCKKWPYEEFSVIKKKQLLKKQNNRASENLLVCFYFINLIECGSGSRRENACRSMRIRSLENWSLYSYTINLPAGPGRALMWQPPGSAPAPWGVRGWWSCWSPWYDQPPR